MTYRIIVNMSFVLPKLKKLKDIKLGEFANELVILELEANDPDDACYLSYKDFCDYILDQNTSSEVRNLLKELKYDFIIIQLLAEE